MSTKKWNFFRIFLILRHTGRGRFWAKTAFLRKNKKTGIESTIRPFEFFIGGAEALAPG
jgi:hypothetical protein